MNAYLQPGHAPVIEASAINGTGVTATLRAAVARIIENLKSNVDATVYEPAPAPPPMMRPPARAEAEVEEEPFGAVAVEVEPENPFELAAEIHDPEAERGDLQALLDGATKTVRALEEALEIARRHETNIRARLR
jgi:hypothetical protein